MFSLGVCSCVAGSRMCVCKHVYVFAFHASLFVLACAQHTPLQKPSLWRWLLSCFGLCGQSSLKYQYGQVESECPIVRACVYRGVCLRYHLFSVCLHLCYACLTVCVQAQMMRMSTEQVLCKVDRETGRDTQTNTHTHTTPTHREKQTETEIDRERWIP